MAIYELIIEEINHTSRMRAARYNLAADLPDSWEFMTLDEQGIWINNNAEFIKDEFYDEKELDTDEDTKEITVLS